MASTKVGGRVLVPQAELDRLLSEAMARVRHTTQAHNGPREQLQRAIGDEMDERLTSTRR